jgi:hypothetical protein
MDRQPSSAWRPPCSPSGSRTNRELELLLEQHHQVHLRRNAGGRSAGDQPAAALERQHGARPGVSADVFEDDIDAALLGQLADNALEAVFAVIDDVIGAKSLGRLDLGVGPNGGDHRAADFLGELDRSRADAGAACMDQDGFARLELCVVKQHVLDRAEGDGRDRGAHSADAGRCRNQKSCRQIDLFLGEAVEMEAVHTADMFAEIVAAFAAGTAQTAGAGAVDRNQLSRDQTRNTLSDGVDRARSLCADDQRHLALGEGHAAPSPDVDMVERDSLDRNGDFTDARGRRRRQIDRLKLAILDQLQCPHG